MKPELTLRLSHGHCLEGHLLRRNADSCVLRSRGQVWFVPLGEIVAIGLVNLPQVQAWLEPDPEPECLSRLGLARLVRDSWPTGLLLEVEGEEAECGWLRGWVQKLGEFFADLQRDPRSAGDGKPSGRESPTASGKCLSEPGWTTVD